MAGRGKGRPKVGQRPEGGKTVRSAADPTGFDHETIVWRFGAVDLDGEWGWRSVASRYWWERILPKLRGFETMTWAELFSAAGGRREGNNHHPVEVERLTKSAVGRLEEIGQDDVSELVSLRLTGTERIYGIRDRRALKLLWYDRYHGNNDRAVCPVRKR